MNPVRPVIASSSGQHHFNGKISDGSESEEAMDVDLNSNETKVKENSLIFWWCGKTIA